MSNKVHTEVIIDASKLPSTTNFETSKHLLDYKKFIDSKSLYYSGPLNNAKVKSIQPKVAYQCKMNILMEERELIWSKKPSKKRQNHCIQPIFDIWSDYQFQLPLLSDKKPEQKRSLTEHDYTTNCEACQGQGSINCTNHRCINGSEKCLSCTQGRKSDGTQCPSCKNGLVNCKTCNGKGRLQCTKCEGCGAFYNSAVLHVSWETRTSTWYYQNSFLPEEKIAQADKISLWSKSETPWTKESTIEDFVHTINDQNSNVPLKANVIKDYKEKHLNETIKLKNKMRRLICDIERLDFEEIEYILESKYLNKHDPSKGNKFRFCQYKDAQGHDIIYENDYPLNSCGCMGGCCACYNCSCTIL
ncbi:unnamed protein product [Adineta steineri]|uniref:Uncharacterized protein n=2 Tax=Adineta steineri TaxID=433720 RepID=A0A813Y683_9BILA|nr:unnamed protein product [Adineta steineri]CAF1324455.1 unnamed protein product [Adineta steineri]